MRKRHLVVGLVMFMASVVSHSSYQPVFMTVVTAADESANVETTAAVTPVSEVTDTVPFMADTALMFASGVVLFGLAAGVRRHIS